MTGLTCELKSDDEYATWWHSDLKDYEQMSLRRKKCSSCGVKIPLGSLCAAIPRYRIDGSERSEGTHADKLKLASWWLCEICADIHNNLTAIGYCIAPGDDCRELIREYAGMTKDIAARAKHNG